MDYIIIVRYRDMSRAVSRGTLVKSQERAGKSLPVVNPEMCGWTLFIQRHMKDGVLCDDSGDDGNSVACSEETWMAGRNEIISFVSWRRASALQLTQQLQEQGLALQRKWGRRKKKKNTDNLRSE